MKKRVMAGALSLVLVFALAACASTAAQQEQSDESSAAESASPQSSEEPAASQNEKAEENTGAGLPEDINISGDPRDMQLYLDGKLYTLPTPLFVFEQDGWLLESGREQPIAYTDFGDGENQVLLRKGSEELQVTVANFHTLDLTPIVQGTVTGVKYDGALPAAVAGGVGIGSHEDEVFAVYENTYLGGDLASLHWSVAELLEYHFTLDRDTERITGIAIDGGGMGEGTTSYDMTTPDLVVGYQAPAELGDHWTGDTLRLDGVLYQMPAPLSAFFDNGWQEDPGDADLLAAKRSTRYPRELKKGNATIQINLYNFEAVAQPVSNSFVYMVSCGDMELDFALPGEITAATTAEQVLEQLGEPAEIDSSGEYYYFRESGDDTHVLQLRISPETGKLLRFTLTAKSAGDYSRDWA